MLKKLSIIIPVYNEEKTLKKIFKRIANQTYVRKEIIVINDASTDNSLKILKNLEKKFNILILNNSKNIGKGFSVSRGISKATGEYTIIQDADLEYHPKDYKKMLKLISKNNKVVYGSRFINYKLKNFRYIVNKFLTLVSNLLYKQNLTDAHTCYRMIDTKLLKKLKINEKRFAIEIEINAKIAAKKIKITETPISYIARNAKQGKKIGITDGIEAIYKLLKYKFTYFKKI